MGSNFFVRPAAVGDGFGIAEVQVESWRDAYCEILPAHELAQMDLREIAERREAKLALGEIDGFVAVSSDQVIGYAIVGPNKNPPLPGDFELSALYVRPSHQGNGVGRALIRAAIAERTGPMIVWALRDNHPARIFYAALGGQHVGSSTYAIFGVEYPDEAYVYEDLAKLEQRLVPSYVRKLTADDDITELTHLLHRAYAKNLALGLRFTACDQPPSRTAEKLSEGTGLILERDGVIVGTATVICPKHLPYGTYSPAGTIACLTQFAVEPALQSLGLGYQLLRAAERTARQNGAKELTLDTAKPAEHLVAYYQRQGFQIVGDVDYRPHTNYESWVMAKPL